MSTAIPDQRRMAVRFRRLKVAIIIADIGCGVLFAVASLTALAPGRAVAIGFGAVIALLAFHLSVAPIIDRCDNAAERSSGFRAIALAAASYALAALFILWVLGIGALARALGMPMAGGLCDLLTSLHPYHFAVAAIFVLGCTAWHAVSQAVACARRKRTATGTA